MYTQQHPVTYYFYPLFSSETPPEAFEQLDQSFSHEPDHGVETLLYLHIPYCHDFCRFCPFHVRVDKDEAVYHRYAKALCTELRSVGETRRGSASTVRAVYFGGGSPSILPAALLRDIFQAIHRHFKLSSSVEISFEGEPKTLSDPARLDVLKTCGATRISFGLQTYDEALRTHFNINATLDDIDRARRLGKDLQFDEINVDMMYNLPGQTIVHLHQDIQRLVSDGFDSVDYYNLHYYAFSKKFNENMNKGLIPPRPSDGVMQALAVEVRLQLPLLGYTNVADQVFSKKPKVCEYFRLLWGGGSGRHDAETLAIGASARGYVNGRCYMNQGNANRYMEAIEAGASPVEKVSNVLRSPANRGAVFFSKFLSIDKTATEALDSLPEGMLERWVDAGYLYDDGAAYRLSELGKAWVNNISQDAFEQEQEHTAHSALVHLSSTPGVRTGSF